MNTVTVKKRFDVQGRDANEVGRRIQKLSEAIQTRGGKLLDIVWIPADAATRPTLSVTYQIPLAASAQSRLAARTPLVRT